MTTTKSLYYQIQDGLTQLLGQDLTPEQAGVLRRLRQEDLTLEQFDYCVREAPFDALRYCAIKLNQVKYELRYHSNELTQAQLDYCVSRREKYNYLFFDALSADLENQCFEVRNPKIAMILYIILIMILTLSFLSIFLQAYYN